MKNMTFKGTLIFAAMIVLAAAIGLSAKNSGKASMKFAEPIYDFGIVKEDGGAVSHEFDFENAGSANLIIYEGRLRVHAPGLPEGSYCPRKAREDKSDI